MVLAEDPEDGQLTPTFALDDVEVVRGNRWEYTVDESGTAVVSAVVTDGQYEREVVWNLERKPPRNEPPVIISFAPQTAEVTTTVGATVAFSVVAVDPEDGPLDATFTLNGVEVAVGRRWDYHVDEDGVAEVRASVSDGEFDLEVVWTLERIVSPNEPPVIQSFLPPSLDVTVPVGEVVAFVVIAEDPEDGPLMPSFTLDGTPTFTGQRWEYSVDAEGPAVVRAVVSDGEFERDVVWNLERIAVPNQPPVILSFAPAQLALVASVGAVIDFHLVAEDPEDGPLTAAFTLDGVEVFRGEQWQYQVEALGPVEVRAVVTDGEHERDVVWTVERIGDFETPINVTSVTSTSNPGELYVEWFSLDPTVAGPVVAYDVHGGSEPIDDHESWLGADVKRRFAAPGGAPGGAQLMGETISGLIPASTAYVGVRALNDAEELSPLGLSRGTRTLGVTVNGVVRNALTDGPAAGLWVNYLGRTGTVDGAGQFRIEDLPLDEGRLDVMDENDPGEVGSFFDFGMTLVGSHEPDLQLYVLPNVPLESVIYPDFLTWYIGITTIGGMPAWKQTRRWEYPVDVYVPPFTAHDLDYRETVVSAIEEFDQFVGLDLFRVVDSLGTTGVTVRFGRDRDRYTVLAWSADWYPVRGQIDLRSVFDERLLRQFLITIRHELGHALGLAHSEDSIHLMVMGVFPGVEFPTPDELKAIRTFYNLPRGYPVRFFSWN